MSRLWSDIVTRLDPYVAGEQPAMAGLVKLNTNENPYGPSPHVLAAIRKATNDDLRRYPDPTARLLREAIAAYNGVTPDRVFVGNGSDEVLAFTFAGLLKHDEPLLFPDITYSFYQTYSRLYDIDTRLVPLDDGFRIQTGNYDGPCGAIILSNPNAPTGIGLPLADIEALVASHADRVVVIDEAYIDFGGQTAIPLVSRHDNLLVVQTFSKSRALAGLRIGFAIGHPKLIEALERVKDSFNSYPLDTLAQVAAIAAITDEAWFRQSCDRLMASRQMLAEALGTRGFEVLPSQANFLFVRLAGRSGAEIAEKLRARSIVVRHFAKPRIADFLRISIGTAEECRRLIEAIDLIL